VRAWGGGDPCRRGRAGLVSGRARGKRRFGGFFGKEVSLIHGAGGASFYAERVGHGKDKRVPARGVCWGGLPVHMRHPRSKCTQEPGKGNPGPLGGGGSDGGE